MFLGEIPRRSRLALLGRRRGSDRVSRNGRQRSCNQSQPFLQRLIALLILVVPLPAAAQENSQATGKPTISGTARVGQTLYAYVSAIEDTDGLENATFEYQWIRNDGVTDQNISNATDDSYRLVSDDAGKTIKVRVSFNDDASNPEELTSDPTETVAPNNLATGTPTISGTMRVGEYLTVDTSSIADADGINRDGFRFSFNWGASGYFRAAGRVDTYRAAPWDAGLTIDVKVSFEDDLGNDEEFDITATQAVAATNPSPPHGLQVSSLSAGTLDISWQAPEWSSDRDLADFLAGGTNVGDGGSPITGYTVQWKESADSWDTPADVSEETVTGTTHTITGLTGGAEYTLRVIATNSVGDSQPSDEATGTPIDATAPELSTITVNGATLTLTYNETLDGGSEPAASAFSVSVNSSVRGVSAVSVDARAVTLTLASAVASGDTVTVSYTNPSDTAAARIQDPSSNAAPSFSGQSATNNTGTTSAPTPDQPETGDVPGTSDPALGVPSFTGSGAIANASGDIEVTWMPGANSVGQLLMLFTSDFVGDPVVATKGATDTTHTFTNVPEGDYVVIVVAYNEAVDIQLTITTVSVPGS